MTSTTEAAGHPHVEELSDLSEGLLAPSRTTDVRRHLDDCTPCADVYGSLEEIRGLLGTLPGPPRMPDDVASRIDAALTAEALLSATTPDATGAPSPKPAAAHVSRETSPSSAADRASGHAPAAGGAGRPKSSAHLVRSSQRTRRGGRRTVVLGAVFTAATLGLGTLLVQTLGNNDTGETPHTATEHQTDAAHTYSEGTLQSQVTSLLATQKTGDSRSGNAKPWGIESDSGTRGSQDGQTANLPSCVEQAVHAHQAVLAADQGVYRGTAVYLVVTPDASDTTKVTAYIVDAACVKQASASPGKVLLTHSYARS